jgi:5,10-methylenetetrahydromethanopterin reductase
MLTFGVVFTPSRSQDESLALATIADRNKIDFLWAGDETPANGMRDVYVTLTYIATQTRRIRIGPGVCNPYSRNIVMTLCEALTLEEMIPHRTTFGLGPGGSFPLTPLGIPMWNKPIKAVRESLVLARTIFSGQKASISGEFATANGVQSHLGKVNIPIYLAVRGLQMAKLAGELADGTLIATPLPYLRHVVAKLREGARAANRDFSDLDVGCVIQAMVSEDAEKARAAARHVAALTTIDSPESIINEVGISVSDQDELRRTYRDKGMDAAVELVTDKMVDAFTVAGDSEHCARVCKEFISAGAKQLVFGVPLGAEGVKELERISQSVIPALESESADS